VNPIVRTAPRTFEAARLEAIFDECFSVSYRTRLRGGAEEPYYQPADNPAEYHVLHYRSDFFASALHEVAHWCIAGEYRRGQPDFGYWYIAGNRDVDQQRAFEAAESSPQALEWIFSRACGYRFRPSADNPELGQRGLLDIAGFNRCILQQACAWQARGLTPRSRLFYRALCIEFHTVCSPGELCLKLDELG
jgi:elongation factor P hydroxylase